MVEAKWIKDQKEFDKLVSDIWKEIEHPKNPQAQATCNIKDEHRKKSKYTEKENETGFVNVVCTGEKHIIIG